MTKMTEHFLPDYHHWGEITTRIEELITVPIRRVPKVNQWTGDPPFVVFACSWYHLNANGPLTQDKFNEDLEGAIQDFTRGINEHDEFRAYPITHNPPTTWGIAYHNWCGAVYPFDIRAVIALDENIEVGEDTAAGLKFHILTLMGVQKDGD